LEPNSCILQLSVAIGFLQRLLFILNQVNGRGKSMTEANERRTRRTEGVRTRGRAARIVDDVLCATAEELSHVGYAALRVEDVAQRSGVNKTTIYRRWPTKVDLVAAVLRNITQKPNAPNTNCLREDLLTSLREIVNFASTTLGRGLVRMIQTERAHPEVDSIAKSLREENRKVRLGIVQQAIERGELPRATDAKLIVDLIYSTIMSHVITHGEAIEDDYVVSVVDFVLNGAHYQANLPAVQQAVDPTGT
jgi:AcrR family transcriptional regulator